MIAMRGLVPLELGFCTMTLGVLVNACSGISLIREEGVADRDTGMSGCKSKGGGGKSVAKRNWKEGVELGVDPMDRVVLAEGVIDVVSREGPDADWEVDGCKA